MKIDAYTHILTPRYREALFKRADGRFYKGRWDQVIEATWALSDLDNRFRVMDEHQGLAQVLTAASPDVDEAASPEDAAYLAQVGNDETAELVQKYPDRFPAAAASLALSDVDAALKETDRAINDLKLKGVQLYTSVNGKALDSPEFMPIYEKMAGYDLPIWLHPTRGREVSDYPATELHSRYYVFQMFGWPYESTVAMARLVFAGVFERYPNLKIITHHCGAMVPYFAERITIGQDYAEVFLKARWKQALSKPPIDYFHMFYGDTALNGNPAALSCGYSFFGPEHVIFATDFPYDNEGGGRFTRECIKAVELLDAPEKQKKMVYEGNIRRLLHLG